MTEPKRALILAGGGLKVAFQAGVLQVWLDEAGIRFDHADAASGGVFNLAMWCQGMSGTEIADNWRAYRPLDAVSPNWRAYPRLLHGESLFTLDGLRERVFRRWGLDWEAIRGTERSATFNLYNFSRHRIEAVPADRMTEDQLVAAVSLPMWFPPVRIGGEVCIDSVFVTDANIEEAIRRGADELWIIWTVSESGEWFDGFLANYFQIIEASAVGDLRRVLARIEESNRRIAAGEPGEFERPLRVRMLAAEVPMHYLIALSGDRVVRAVDAGVRAAREWCAREGIGLRAPAPRPVPGGPGLRFKEAMRGRIAFGEDDPRAGAVQRGAEPIEHRLAMHIDSVERFVLDPEHEARAEGTVVCDALGGRLAVERGAFNCFVDDGAPTRKHMLYRLHFRDATGRSLTLSGRKEIRNDPGFDLWSDTTTLFVRILSGHVGRDEEEKAEVVAAGVMRLDALDLARLALSFRPRAARWREGADAVMRFGRFFLGDLWDVYARRVLAWSPV